MTKDLLWEIGVEEIPARFLPSTVKQMKELAEQGFAAAGLVYQRLDTYATPRRLALMVEGLAEKAADQEVEAKGPAKKAAYDEQGQPTRALEGFCKGQGVQVSDLFEKEIKDNIYMFALKKSTGQDTALLLPEILVNVVEKIYFPKPMRWGYHTLRFARPIHWLVALFGSEVIDIDFAGLVSGRVTRGHRLLGSDHIEISEPAAYKQLLRDNYVIVDQAERCELIIKSINEVAASFGGKVEEDDQLLEEVTYILEYPTALVGNFDHKYLAIPEELITTPMVDQQRYFPVYGKDGKLLPKFITVRNGDGRFLDIVAQGNEKVLHARLADAEFFYKEDLADKMDDKVEELSQVVFHEKLGTLRQKVERIIRLSQFIAGQLGFSAAEIAETNRAAYLAKADLGSRVVYEFPELQGVIGEYYALAAGEDATVAKAIREHYLPRFAGDELPESKPGIAVALADKLDSIAGFFAMGIIPSGSQDPYALRRAAAGCTQIIIRNGLNIRMRDILPYAFELVKADATSLGAADTAETAVKVINFLNQRVENTLSDQGISYDVINAVREGLTAGEGDIIGLFSRAHALQIYKQSDKFPAVLSAMTRIGNIMRAVAGDAEATVDPGLFVDESEGRLFAAVERLGEQVKAAIAACEYEKILPYLSELTPYVHDFFEAVMVMDKDDAVRANRQALLKRILMITDEIGDFAKIVE